MKNVNNPADIDRMIAESVVRGCGWMTELLRPVRDGQISLYNVTRSGNPPLGRIRKQTRPTIVILGDDDQVPTGPGGFSHLQPLLKWATGGMIHGAGGCVSTYRMAATLAALAGRFLLVETDSAHLNEWAQAFGSVPFVGVIPKGGKHPMQSGAGAVQ